MKLVLLFVLCLSVYCICAVRLREWGSAKGYTNFKTEQVVMKERNGKTVTRFVKYPKVSMIEFKVIFLLHMISIFTALVVISKVYTPCH